MLLHLTAERRRLTPTVAHDDWHTAIFIQSHLLYLLITEFQVWRCDQFRYHAQVETPCHVWRNFSLELHGYPHTLGKSDLELTPVRNQCPSSLAPTTALRPCTPAVNYNHDIFWKIYWAREPRHPSAFTSASVAGLKSIRWFQFDLVGWSFANSRAIWLLICDQGMWGVALQNRGCDFIDSLTPGVSTRVLLLPATTRLVYARWLPFPS